MNFASNRTFVLLMCLCISVREILSWGIRGKDDGGSAQAIEDFDANKPFVAEGATTQKDFMTPKPSKTNSGDSMKSENGDKNRRQYVSGRQYKLSNVSVEYVPGKENGTWSVEKQEKIIELSKEVLETQHATCQVTTEELVATAQATVTRVLKGLCNAKEMENRFNDMEILLSNQLQIIKEMITNVEDKLGDQEEKLIQGQKQLSNLVKDLGNSANSYKSSFQTSSSDSNKKTSKLVQDYNVGLGAKGRPVEAEEEEIYEEDVAGPREPEILKYNSSIHMESSLNGPPKKVFTYYWKIRHMQYKLTGWSSQRSLRSQSFYVFPSGYRMYMRIFPRQSEENFYIHVGVTKGDFDDLLQWPFPLKHKVHILDQTKEGKTFEDIASRIWDPDNLCSEFNWQKPVKGDNYECVGLGFPHDVLQQREYIRKDTIVIKLTVYLDL